MNRRTILYVINADTPDERISEAAEAAAQNQDHLICMLLGVAPTLPMNAFGAMPYGGISVGDDWNERATKIRAAQQDRVQEIEGLLAKSNTSGDVQSVICATVDTKHIVARSARVSDEAYIDSSLREEPELLREVASGVLYHSPIGFRINGSVFQNASRIFIAWDSSNAAASAVHAALPHLKAAKEVMIACIDPVMTADDSGQDPGTDLAAWLSHHGCNVTVSQFPSGGRDIARCIQDHAREFGADLVVMGAYGHARMIQTVLGGTTRSMIEQTDLPVLLAH